eukprot:1317368-Amorphochlora_amoeboformis.AAC.1
MKTSINSRQPVRGSHVSRHCPFENDSYRLPPMESAVSGAGSQAEKKGKDVKPGLKIILLGESGVGKSK